MFGYTSEEIIGKAGSILGPEDRATEISDILATIKAGKHIEPLETYRVRQDGTAFPVALTVSPIRDADREGHGRVSSGTDAGDLTIHR
jgi:PAS domain S-box-containing protein